MLKINNKNLNQIFVRAVVSRGSQCAYISDDHAMKTAWLINDVVLFEPDERRLCAIQNYPAQCIILHGPVNECLLQLLLHNGEVLSQRFLFDAVWGKQGAVVTTNALYQAIASVRKALKSAGLADDVIKTIPKAGFKSVAQICAGKRPIFCHRGQLSLSLLRPGICPLRMTI
jgi:DNA-binding winged helix-turn-helix (wHTH) protein